MLGDGSSTHGFARRRGRDVAGANSFGCRRDRRGSGQRDPQKLNRESRGKAERDPTEQIDHGHVGRGAQLLREVTRSRL